MKKLALIICCALAVINLTYANSHEESTPDGLIEAKSKFKETWVVPGTDFTQYNKIKPGESHFEFRDVGSAEKTSSSLRNSRKTDYGILDVDKLKFEEEVSMAFRKELERSKKFALTDISGPGTLILHGAVVDIVSNVPPPTVGRSDIYLATIGSGTWVLELEDAATGKIIVKVSERRKIQQNLGGIDETTMPANTVTIWAEIRRWSQRAARKLRTELEKAQKG